MSPLVYLAWRSLRGRVVGWARLMRQPRYLVGTLAGATWMGLFALRPVMRVNREANLDRVPELDAWLPTLELGGALLLLALVSLWWLWPFGKALVELSETELHLLLPAPVRRRHIIQYAVLRSQWGVLFGAAMIAFFSSGGRLSTFLWRLLSMWMLLTLWNLHARGRGLWMARLSELPTTTAWQRRALFVGAAGLVLATMAQALTSVVGSVPDLGGDVSETLRNTLHPDWFRTHHPALSLLLLPFRWLVRLVLSGVSGPLSLIDRAGLLVWPALLIVVHNEWVVRSQASFEDASLARSRRLAASREAGARFQKLRHSRRAAAPFRLGPQGRPEIAILWKNLMLAHRTPLARATGAVLVLLGTATVVVSWVAAPTWLIGILTVGALVALVMTPLTAGHQWRNDLRTDLLRVELIRTWPVAGWRLFGAEVAAPAIIASLYATAAAGVLVVAGVAASHPNAADVVLVSESGAAALGSTPLRVLLAGLLTLIPLLGVIATLSATLQNLLALVWPSWVQLGRRRSGSAAHIGQGLITSLGLMVAMVVGLLPGLVVSGGWLLLQVQVLEIPLRAWQLPLLGVVTAVPLALIIAVLIRFGGLLWDQLDPSAELLNAPTPGR